MSGLCGVVDWGGVVSSSVVEAMLGAAPWRGADGNGSWWGDGVGLGFARLAITPEDDIEVQPFDDGRVTVIADCRLDDRQPLIDQLEEMGPWRWGTPTDVELVARAYHRWDQDCASHLLGDFAFAIWDQRHRRLLLARDPMGMRPLYYHPTHTGIVFASEIKQILTHPKVPRRIHEPFIAAHLAGIYGPAEWTAYQTIHQLAPATTLTHDGTTPRTHTHWQPDPEHRIELDTETEYAQLLKDTLTRAVADRLRTSRQPGLLLSGGMDSGSVASIAGHLHQHHPTTPLLHTYSWAFTELPQCDERHISRHITDHYQLPTHDIPADQLWPLAHYPQHGPDPDEPYIGAYQPLIEHTLQTATNTGTHLLLGGDRGDEVMGDRVYDTLGLIRSRRLAIALREGSSALEAMGGKRGLLRRIVAGRTRRPTPSWMRQEFTERHGLADLHGAAPADPWTRRRDVALTGHAPRVATLRERERARQGLGSADPWSDRRLTELSLAIPAWMVTRRTSPKHLLHEALRDVMPQEAHKAAGKIEPVALFHRGLKHEARATVEDLLVNSRLETAGWVDADEVSRIYASWLAGGRLPFDFWWVLSGEMWMRSYW